MFLHVAPIAMLRCSTMMQVCVWVDSTNDRTDGTNGTDSKEKTSTSRSGPFCFDREQGELPINGLQVGSHRFVVLVRRFAFVTYQVPDTGY